MEGKRQLEGGGRTGLCARGKDSRQVEDFAERGVSKNAALDVDGRVITRHLEEAVLQVDDEQHHIVLVDALVREASLCRSSVNSPGVFGIDEGAPVMVEEMSRDRWVPMSRDCCFLLPSYTAPCRSSYSHSSRRYASNWMFDVHDVP